MLKLFILIKHFSVILDPLFRTIPIEDFWKIIIHENLLQIYWFTDTFQQRNIVKEKIQLAYKSGSMIKVLNLKICCLYSNMHLWYLCIWKTLLISVRDLTILDFHVIYDPDTFSHFVFIYQLKNPTM